MNIKAIQSDIKTEWTQFEELMRETLRSDYDLLNQINSHLFDNKGKQIRPLLGLLAAKCCGPINSFTISCAVVSEMLHTASLLHDDVADQAPQRRGAQTEKILEDMESYAYNLGLAFQIRDDIFDYTPQLNTGKPYGADIKEKKLTLPLILALKSATIEERESLLRDIRFAEAEDEHLVERTFAIVEKYSGNASAQKALNEHCRKAEESLSGLKESIYKNHLIELTRFVGSRES